MAPPGNNIKGTDAAPGLQADIDSLLDGMDATVERVEVAAAAAASPAAGRSSLQQNVAELLADAPPPQPSPDPIQAIDSLDAQLAELTAELLETNKTAVAPTPKVEAPVVEEAPVAVQAPIRHEPVAPEVPRPERPSFDPHSVAPPPPVPRGPTPEVIPSASLAAVSSIESESLNAAPSDKEPGAVLRALAAISAPVNKSSHLVRVLVTVMAIQTLVLGACVWAWLYVRPPIEPKQGPAFRLSTDTLPRPVEPETTSPKNVGEGAAKADAKAPAKPPAKKSPAKAPTAH
jgi:hypothetical protein